MHYSEKDCQWLLQEAGEGDEVHIRNYSPTTNSVNKSVSKHRAVHWYSVCSTHGYEEPYLWLNDHENRRGIYSVQKHKLNIKSSTEAKIVRVDDDRNQVIWSQYLLKDQGYNIHNNIIYQNNQSAIRLYNNGMPLIRKRIRHINTRYYLSLIGSQVRSHPWDYVPPLKLLGIISQRHYRGLNFAAYATSLFVCTVITSQPTKRLEYDCSKKKMNKEKEEYQKASKSSRQLWSAWNMARGRENFNIVHAYFTHT